MPEKSRLRELVDTYVMAGRGKVEIDQLLNELEQRVATAKASGAYEAGRDHAPAIAELVETKDRLQRAVNDARRWLAKLHPKCRRLGTGVEGRCPICRALDAAVATPPTSDTRKADALSGILWHACVTGDCPHSDVRDCGRMLVTFIGEIGRELAAPPPSSGPDTPETVAEKAKAARAIGDRFADLLGGKPR